MVKRQERKTGRRSHRRHFTVRAREQQIASETTNATSSAHIPKKNGVVRVIPLGGCEEIGRNMTLVECENDILIIDMGLQWPEEDMHGIDYIIPNIEYLKGKERNIRGVILTHGHLDHIGAIPHLLPKLGNPLIIGAPMTLALVKKQIENHHQKFVPQTLEVRSLKKPTRLGKFRVNFFQVEHSVVDSLGVVIETSVVN